MSIYSPQAIAQQFTIDRPVLVRKLILVGTGPRSGEGMASPTPEAQEIFWRQVRCSRRVVSSCLTGDRFWSVEKKLVS
jgi:pimeloyl-ACP methyl ester carboxylesterase